MSPLRRKQTRRIHRTAARGRPLFCEPLEHRRLLAFTAAIEPLTVGFQVTFQGDATSENLLLSVDSSGNLQHNRFAAGDPGFDSAIDLDTSAAGTQSLNVANIGALIAQGGGGDDTLDASALSIPVQFNGGDGNDTLIGSAAADALVGDAGNDRLVGFRGNDVMEGGDGDDRMIWNNGDGSDTMIGGAGTDTSEVNGAAAAGDNFVIGTGTPGPVVFQRVNLGPFRLDITAENLEVNGGGGDDTVTGGNGLAGLILLTVDGGPGDDHITGGDGPDTLLGGAGDDTLIGGAGDDVLRGDEGVDIYNAGPGDDTIFFAPPDKKKILGPDGGNVIRV